jgi:hypothetical protein
MGRVWSGPMTRRPGMYWASQNCGSAIQIWNTDQNSASAAMRSATARLSGARPPVSADDTRS